MNLDIGILITIIGSIFASSGFWAYLQRRHDKKDVRTRMLIGLGHDRVIYLGLKYVERGWITQDEYENLYEYLFKPYTEIGGNGSAEKVMHEVNKLPMCKSNISRMVKGE